MQQVFLKMCDMFDDCKQLYKMCWSLLVQLQLRFKMSN